MLVLFETPAGYAIFKVLDESKLEKIDNLYHSFESPQGASRILKLKHFSKFEDTTEALAATTAVEGKLCKSLKKVLKKECASLQEELAVADAKLANSIKEKLNLQCVSNSATQELMRCIRSQLDGLLGDIPKKEMTAMALGLAHSLSRYKLKFSPDKVDTMIIQAIGLMDDIDKELNNYVMRVREWYGWHFPELGKIVTDNLAFVKTIKTVGTRENAINTDLSDILPEDIEEKVKEAAEISMGTEISEDDIRNILRLCDQIIDMTAYRAHLYDYLKARMMAIAPNLSVLIGDLVGARLISHAALKTKKDTPKYGLVYHSALIGQASTRNKGKMARMLSAKASLCARVDALGEEVTYEMGAEHKVKLESRLRLLEEGNIRKISGTPKAKAAFQKFHAKSEIAEYPVAADSTIKSEVPDRKPLIEEIKEEKDVIEEEVKEKEQNEDDVNEEETKKKKKKKKKRAMEEVEVKVEEVDVKVEEPEENDGGKDKNIVLK
ncbi:unnamed protein product [Trichogramma brassicae]|uniref:Nop domain-containing protein n=1 Tax=Trichogramma brassicae TaxID=86971 RepID=A0A6H5J258_9HYME|nr:unnamed protein product [Trichogramma brassicae]